MTARICLFTDSLAPSGVGQHMLTLAEELRPRHELSFVCPPGPGGTPLLDRARDLGLQAHPLDMREPEADGELQSLLQRGRVDVFHSHAGNSLEGHTGVRAAAAAAVPAIVRTEHLAELSALFPLEELPDLVYSPYHLPDRRPGPAELTELVARERSAYRERVRQVDRIICVSAGVRDTYLEVGVEPERLTVVRNGIHESPATSTREQTRQRSGLAQDRPLVLSVGRMIDVKGHLFTLSAVEEVRRHRPDVLFMWVGSGPLEPALREEVAARGLEESVWFAGHRDDVPDLIAAADLLLLASMAEGLPLVVLEAMAAGRPVVATRVCGTTEAVEDGVTGRLVEPGRLDGSGDGGPLAEAVLEPLLDPSVAARWGSAGRARFEEAFTADRMARETASVYDELLARPRTRDRVVRPGGAG